MRLRLSLQNLPCLKEGKLGFAEQERFFATAEAAPLILSTIKSYNFIVDREY